MSETNEAAERLDFHFRLECEGIDAEGIEAASRDIDAALAAERRATVERIRERMTAEFHRYYCNPVTVSGPQHRMPPCGEVVDAILDEEAAR